MYNRLKKNAEAVSAQESMLQENNKRDDLSIDGNLPADKQLESVRDNTDLNETTEKQMIGNRDKEANTVTEKQLDSSASPLVKHRSNWEDSISVRPIDMLNRAQEKERSEIYRKAMEQRETSFWDEYANSNWRDDSTTMISKSGPCQLADNPDRFQGLSTDISKLVDSGKVKKMVTAALQDADAMLFHIYAQAAAQNRDLLPDEKALVAGISRDKFTILAQFGSVAGEAERVATRIQEVKQLLAQTNPADDAFDAYQEELANLIETGRRLTAQPS